MQQGAYQMATFDEYVKFKTNKPEAQREFRTLEIYHPSKTEVIRIVQDYNEYIGWLETTAPRNAGELVTFLPFAGDIVEPTESNDAEQSISVNIADINSEIPKYLDSFDGFDWLEPIQVIYRKYWSGDNSQPATPPAYLFATTPSYDSTNSEAPISTTFVASDVDLSQKRAGIIYTVRQFPGLA